MLECLSLGPRRTLVVLRRDSNRAEIAPRIRRFGRSTFAPPGDRHRHMQTQVLVVGAGPAGSAAAYSLARHGVGVVLADQCTFPRDKTCGDGISPAGVRVLMRIGVLDPAELTRGKRRLFSGVRIVAPGGASVDLHYPWPSQQTGFGQGCVIPRHELDAMLVERAIAAGATFLPGFRATKPIWSSGRVAGLDGICHGSAMAVKADVTVVATGARLHLLRALGLCDAAPPLTVGVRQYLRLPTDAFPGPTIRVYLEPNLLPDYAWVFPVDDRLVNVGLASAGRWRAPDKNSLTALLGRFVGGTSAAASSLAGAVPVGPPTGAPLRADFLRRKTCAAGVLVAGEAAGLVDPLTGEGISFALQSGELAAEVAYRATLAHEFERALCTYGRTLRRRFAAYFGFAWQLRSRLTDPRLANALVSLAAQLKQARTSGWVSPAGAQALRSVLRWLPALGLSPYLAYRMMNIRSHRIEL